MKDNVIFHPLALAPPQGGWRCRTKLTIHGNRWRLSPTGLNARRAVFFMAHYRAVRRRYGIVLRFSALAFRVQ